MAARSRVIATPGPRAIAHEQSPCTTAREQCRTRGFTLIELLVVISIIALLVALLTVGGSHVVEQQRVNYTKNIMRSTGMALDQFRELDPLASVYNRRNKATFGDIPPYQLMGAGGTNNVADTLEPEHPVLRDEPASLAERLAADLSGKRNPTVDSWARLNATDRDEVFDDSRALYVYLKLYVPDALAAVPEDVIKRLPKEPDKLDVPLTVAEREFVDRHGTASDAGSTTRVDILGIHDAWGVPLEYYAHVKLEYGLPPGGGSAAWFVAERTPVLRSRGVRGEVFEAAHQVSEGDALYGVTDPTKCLYSEEFPAPAAMRGNASFKTDGQITTNDPQDNGWTRAVPASQKPVPGAVDVKELGSAFGYVP